MYESLKPQILQFHLSQALPFQMSSWLGTTLRWQYRCRDATFGHGEDWQISLAQRSCCKETGALNSRIGTLIPLRALSRHRHLIGARCELEWKHSQHCAGRAFDAISTFEGSHAAWVCQSDGFGNSVMPWNSLMPMPGLGIPDFSNLLCSWGPRLTFPQNCTRTSSRFVTAHSKVINPPLAGASGVRVYLVPPFQPRSQ